MKKALRIVAILTIFIAVTTFSVDPVGSPSGHASTVNTEMADLA